MKNFGIVPVAIATPQAIEIANPKANALEIVRIYEEIVGGEYKNTPAIIVFPELCVSGYTCGDLFNQTILIEESLEAVKFIAEKTKSSASVKPILFIGAPIRKDNKLFNCAVAISDGNILGFIPKTFIPNYGVFYESRHFASATERLSDEITIDHKSYAFLPNFLIEDSSTGAVIGVDICEDLWVPIPPSSHHTLHGANVIVNLSASNEEVGKADYRRDLVRMQSAQTICGYIYASASQDESTTDHVFSSHSIIAENGVIINEARLIDKQEVLYGEIDIEIIQNERSKMNTYHAIDKKQYLTLKVDSNFILKSNYFSFQREIPLQPFHTKDMHQRSKEILHLQSVGLAQRMKKIGSKKVVIGVSGGLDSTLALIVAVEAFKLNNLPIDGIIGVSMPCFGTSSKTRTNATLLMDLLGITQLEIDIKESVEMHFRDIGHDSSLHDVTYENAQARERTQVLMDIANKYGGFVVGTGDLSELALGFCTYGADAISMYGVNAGVPKGLVATIVSVYASDCSEDIGKVLYDIINTPVSPELLPPNSDGSISQITENIIGSYVIHDFILYYMLRHSFSPRKIMMLYLKALSNSDIELTDKVVEDTTKYFRVFYKRFFGQQYKRSMMPDGVRVGSVSLSPRGDWRMPSDAIGSLWLSELN